MADSASTPSATVTKSNDDFVVANWGTVTGAATGAAVSLGRIETGSMSIQLVGSFGSATFLLAGSNDGVVWKTCYLRRQIATAGKQDTASFTADDAGAVAEDAYRFYRISSSGGTSTAVVVTLLARRR